jgi:hypothetical protein
MTDGEGMSNFPTSRSTQATRNTSSSTPLNNLSDNLDVCYLLEEGRPGQAFLEFSKNRIAALKVLAIMLLF